MPEAYLGPGPAYNITISGFHSKLIPAHRRFQENCPKPCLRPEFAYGITISAPHTKLVLAHRTLSGMLHHCISEA